MRGGGSDFTNFDKDDQEFFQEYLQGALEVDGEGDTSPAAYIAPVHARA